MAEEIDELAQALFRASDPGGVWVALDYGIQRYWRREAVRQLQQRRYAIMRESV